MKKILSLLFTSLFVLNIFAQQITLKSVCEGLSKTPNTTGDFVQTKTVNSNGRKLKSSGNFIFAREGIMWKTVKPFPSSLVVTKTAMIQTAANGTKTVMDGSDNQIFQNIAQTLSSVFSGNSGDLEKNFTIDFQEKGNGEWSVVLTPKDSTISSVMNTLTLGGSVTSANVILNYLEMTETSNNKILYEFSNHKFPKELTADEKANFTVE